MRGLIGVFILAAGLTIVGCNRLFYFPSKQVHGVPRVPYRSLTLTTADGVRLHAWYLPPPPGVPHKGTIVQFHGNAGNITSHYLSLLWARRHGYAVLAFDYRGYGRSQGSPSREGLRLDAQAALRWAYYEAPRGELAADLIVYGQSIGGAVLLDALRGFEPRERIRAVVIESSFHSYEEIAASVLWRQPILFPLTGLGYATVTEEQNPGAAVAEVAPIPLLVLHDQHDEIVPWQFGAALYDLGKEPKAFWVSDHGGHTRVTDDVQIRQALADWWDEPPHVSEARLR